MSKQHWWNDIATGERQSPGTAIYLTTTVHHTLLMSVIFEHDDVQLCGYVGRVLDNT